MRRLVPLAGLAVLAFAPHAAAAGSCGVISSPVRGPAPLTVRFTASCASTAYSWSFGDGRTASGQTVSHTYAAGAWRPTLQTDSGAEDVAPVTSISVSLSGPRSARYAQWVTLRATVTPRLPVRLRGRRFVHGKLRVRVLTTAPWVATVLGTRSRPLRILVRPRLVVRTVGAAVVGSRVRMVATLHPAHAGHVRVPKVDTRTVHIAHLTIRSRPARGWIGVGQTVAIPIIQPNISLGARGPSVLALERRLRELHYGVIVDGSFGDDDVEAVYAFQKVNGLARTGAVDRTLWARLRAAHVPFARYGGDHVEIDKTRQVLFVVRGGKVALVVATSTGATGNTPVGSWHVYRKVVGYDWVLYYPSYFLRGFAVHGYPDVPPYPASHGCARIPMWIAETVYADIAYGSTVYVYV